MTRLDRLARAMRTARFGLVLAVLLLGAAAHWWHHVQDPACAEGVDRDGRTCQLCGTLHVSTLASARTFAPAPRATDWRPVPARRAPAPLARPRRAATPRAPPEG